MPNGFPRVASVWQVPGPSWLLPSALMQPAEPGSWVSAPVVESRRSTTMAGAGSDGRACWLTR